MHLKIFSRLQVLCIVDVHLEEILYFDSMQTTNSHSRHADWVKVWFSEEVERERQDLPHHTLIRLQHINWTVIHNPRHLCQPTPQQIDGSDCGVCTALAIRDIVAQRPFSYAVTDGMRTAYHLRKQMALELAVGCLLPKDKWSEQCACQVTVGRRPALYIA